MSSLINRAALGLTAGAAGTVAMAGTSFIMRRLIEPNQPIRRTHYEAVVEWVIGHELEVEQRIRVGELTHLGFGAFWGAVFTLLDDGDDFNPLIRGTLAGSALWLAAFGGYMPALGITKSIQQMDNYERSRTLLCHLTFGVTAFTFMKTFQGSGPAD